jgi:hypothetical protein
MRLIRMAAGIFGVIVVVIGLVWIGQGTGVFPYPRSSFMINQTPWIYWGLLTALAGLFIVWASRRFRI